MDRLKGYLPIALRSVAALSAGLAVLKVAAHWDVWTVLTAFGTAVGTWTKWHPEEDAQAE